MNPSDSERAKAWLKNFKAEEQPSARLLLDGLDLVGADRLSASLSALIQDLAATLPRPIALVPVREVTQGQSYYPEHNRDAKAKLLFPASFPGSEAIVANLAARLRRQEENDGPFVAAPSLANMRAARCRTILLVDDFSGSGDRLISFDAAFRRHPTIKSWLSRKWITIHVAVFAATATAQARLQENFGPDRVHAHRMCPTFNDRGWTYTERLAIEKLCRDYLNPATGTEPYGYKNSRGLMAFLHSVPNNLPPILWQRGRRFGGWRSFFQGKAVTDDLFSLFGNALPEQRAKQSLARLRQDRLAIGGWRDVAGPETTRILLVLAALSRRPRSLHHVMSMTGLAASEARAILAACRQWKLVGDTLRLTDAGLRELKYARGLSMRNETPLLHGSAKPYYPRSLRVGQ